MSGKIILGEAHGKKEIHGNPLASPGRWPIDTPGGRFYAEWDSQAPVSLEGQLMFFYQFLEAGEQPPHRICQRQPTRPIRRSGRSLIALCGAPFPFLG